jgi:hypothetical protein
MLRPSLFKAARPSFVVSTVLLGVSALFLHAAHAQDATSSQVIVTGQELPSAYGAPPAFSRTRFAPTTTAYVLPPGAFLSATIWEGNWYRREVHPQHFFTQEIEVGLPHRFGLAAEFGAEVFRGRSQIRAVSVEARYAFADWNKIPLNPTLFAEYKFGTGRILKDEALGVHDEEDMPAVDESVRKMTSKMRRGQEEPGEGEEGEEGEPELPDAVEGRLLLAQDFGEHFEWALNGFFEQETGGDRGREWGFAQSVSIPLTRNEYLKVGAEMLYTNFSDKGIRDDPENRFVIGPTIAWKPSRWSRIDVSPLFGVTDESPRAQVFVVFSMLFGGTSAGEAEAPVSTRNR